MITLEKQSFLAMIKKYHNMRKALLIGSGGVGKTSLLNALTKHQYVTQTTEYHRTPFINFGTMSVTNGECDKVRIQFHDVAGQLDLPIHALKDFTTQTLGATDIIFLVFATNDLQTFLDLKTWLELIGQGITTLQIQPQCILLQNKTDLESIIDDSLITKFLEVNPAFKGFFKVNCVNGQGLDQLTGFMRKEVV